MFRAWLLLIPLYNNRMPEWYKVYQYIDIAIKEHQHENFRKTLPRTVLHLSKIKGETKVMQRIFNISEGKYRHTMYNTEALQVSPHLPPEGCTRCGGEVGIDRVPRIAHGGTRGLLVGTVAGRHRAGRKRTRGGHDRGREAGKSAVKAAESFPAVRESVTATNLSRDSERPHKADRWVRATNRTLVIVVVVVVLIERAAQAARVCCRC